MAYTRLGYDLLPVLRRLAGLDDHDRGHEDHEGDEDDGDLDPVQAVVEHQDAQEEEGGQVDELVAQGGLHRQPGGKAF